MKQAYVVVCVSLQNGIKNLIVKEFLSEESAFS